MVSAAASCPRMTSKAILRTSESEIGGRSSPPAAELTCRFPNGELVQLERIACELNDIVRQVYAIGLRLHSVIPLPEAPVNARLQQVIEELDGVVRHPQGASLNLVGDQAR